LSPARAGNHLEMGRDAADLEEQERYRVGQRRAMRRVVAPWSPGQLIPVIVGFFFAVFGMVGLIKTGFHPQNWTGAEKSVLGFDTTSLLALTELVFGLVVAVLAGPLPWAARPVVALLGALSAGFGILLAAFSSSWERFFGGDAGNGWLFIGAGVLLLVAAAIPARRRGTPEAVGPDLESPGGAALER
jgi:hypothetical protein